MSDAACFACFRPIPAARKSAASSAGNSFLPRASNPPGGTSNPRMVLGRAHPVALQALLEVERPGGEDLVGEAGAAWHVERQGERQVERPRERQAENDGASVD